MYKPFRYLILSTLLFSLINTSLMSQKRTYSPFSRYGVGELTPRGLGQNHGMAGTGIGIRNNSHLNNLNPASYSAMDSLSFIVEAGITGFAQTFESDATKETYNNIDFSYFTIAFPISSKFYSSFGLKPFSNAGYNFESSNASTLSTAMGNGNLSSVYGGLAFKPISELSFGMHATYLFGNIQHTSFLEFIDDASAYKYGLQTEIHANDFFFDFGVQYEYKISEDRTLIVGATFRPETGLDGEFKKTVAKGLSYDEAGQLFTSDIPISEASKVTNSTGFNLPQAVGIGASYNWANKLLVAADYYTEQWGDANLNQSISSVTTSNRFSGGLEFTPNDRSQNYLERIQYRGGFKYLEDYIKLNGYQIKDLGISFGVGLPLNRNKTSINLSFDLGKRGTSQDSQVEESYGRIKINFTFHEIWFTKRKFD